MLPRNTLVPEALKEILRKQEWCSICLLENALLCSPYDVRDYQSQLAMHFRSTFCIARYRVWGWRSK